MPSLIYILTPSLTYSLVLLCITVYLTPYDLERHIQSRVSFYLGHRLIVYVREDGLEKTSRLLVGELLQDGYAVCVDDD